MRYWLVKSEPDAFSWDQQVRNGVEPWTGVRNHLAKRHLLAMRTGDRAFFYHSNIGKEIVGIVEVVREGYRDDTAEAGEWACVDVRAAAALRRPVTLAAIKADPALADMALLRLSRLSVGPVTPAEWERVLQLAGGTDPIAAPAWRSAETGARYASNWNKTEETVSDQLYPATQNASSHLDTTTAAAWTERARTDHDGFWAEQAQRVSWMQPPTEVLSGDFTGDVRVRWYEDGVLNASATCLDRHLAERGDQVAIIWEGDDPGVSRTITYRELHEQVCRFANVLKGLGAKKGDRVTIYLPMVVEAAVAMLACARIGAIHSVVFGGFSPDSLANRVQDCDSTILVTADEGRRGGRTVPLKTNADAALKSCPSVQAVVVVPVTGGAVPMQPGRDHPYDELVAQASPDCPPEPMEAEAPLFILYTSGSTGKPKGVLHTTGGYMVWAAMTHQLVFDYRPGEIYWCTADVGWVTGHTYILYGPLANGATTLMFEGIPTYPDSSRFWRVIDKHGVNIFYTAPTAVRSLMRDGDGPVKATSRTSLRLLGSVGEPINPEAWLWYYRVVGEERCPIVDTWWQTETGGILISPLPAATALKPGSATLPLPGVVPLLVDAEGNPLEGAAEGNLCIAAPWPGMLRTVFRDHDRFVQTYFSTFPGRYFTGDGARRDEDGYYWITGRVDDVINVSGHRMGTAEVESALVAHPKVAEAAVVGFPHDLKGQGIYAYVTLIADEEPTEALRKELVAWVRREIGPIASPDAIQWAPGLPKTRSGKIMRRILRKIAANETDGLGDTSTLADPAVVTELIDNRVS